MEVSFKKKAKRAGAGRKRSRRPVEDDEGAGDAREGSEIPVEDEIQRSIEQVREDQRLRAQVLREELLAHRPEAEKQKKKAPSSADADAKQYGLHDPKKDGSANKKLLTLLDGQFTGQSATSEKDQHEELMNKFIEERLQKKRKTEEQLDEKDERDPVKSAEDALFELPAHLNPDVPKVSASFEDAGESGGMLMGSAGIAEVELPASYAEKTERATKVALERSKAGASKRDAIGGLASSALPANFSVDFNRHRSDFVADLKSLNKDEQRERGFQKVGKNQASDDRAVSRFRKFESLKQRR